MEVYDEILLARSSDDIEKIIAYLSAELPDLWCWDYEDMTFTEDYPYDDVDIWYMHEGTFTYIHDASELQLPRLYDDIPRVSERFVAVFGRSCAPKTKRDTSRMRGWQGPTQRRFGTKYDKGHFIAHAAGGDLTLNLFFQRRDINRGWSKRGKLYREMERYCAAHFGTFCFSRPFYDDRTWQPCAIEFGLLMQEGALWVEEFEN